MLLRYKIKKQFVNDSRNFKYIEKITNLLIMMNVKNYSDIVCKISRLKYYAGVEN